MEKQPEVSDSVKDSVPKDNVSFIMKAFKEFYDKNVLKNQEFDIEAFMNFMEPKFAKAGYRQEFNPNLTAQKKNTGGVTY